MHLYMCARVHVCLCLCFSLTDLCDGSQCSCHLEPRPCRRVAVALRLSVSVCLCPLLAGGGRGEGVPSGPRFLVALSPAVSCLVLEVPAVDEKEDANTLTS